LLFKDIATLRCDAPLFQSVDELRWPGPDAGFQTVADDLGAPELAERARNLAQR
jgi:hypothetical protein